MRHPSFDFRAAHQWLHGYSAGLEGRELHPDDPDYAEQYTSGWKSGNRDRKAAQS